jgi:tetratricopeptide (TPR) repeat protein
MLIFALTTAACLLAALTWLLRRPAWRHQAPVIRAPSSAEFAAILGIPLATLALYGAIGHPAAIEDSAAPAPMAAIASGSGGSGGSAGPSSPAMSAAPAGSAQPSSEQRALEATAAALAQAGAARNAGSQNGPDIEALLKRLQTRLQTQPDDLDGWMMLAHSLASMSRFGEAANAYAQAARLAPRDAQVLADWADALAMAQSRSAAGEPTRLLAAALALDPSNLKALVMSGSAALERGDPGSATKHFEAAHRLAPPDSSLAQSLQQQLAALREHAPAGKP